MGSFYIYFSPLFGKAYLKEIRQLAALLKARGIESYQPEPLSSPADYMFIDQHPNPQGSVLLARQISDMLVNFEG